MNSVDIAGNRKGQPDYPKGFKRQVAMTACEPGISVAKLAMAHQLNVNMVFRWRRGLRAREAEPAQVSPTLLPIVMRSREVRKTGTSSAWWPGPARSGEGGDS